MRAAEENEVLLLDIGNTHTRIGCSDGTAIRLLRTLPTADLTAEDLPKDARIAAASVEPRAAERLSARKIAFVTAENCGDLIDFSAVDASTLGADRVANAIAAAEFYELPALVIDCGSAITCELVDEKRRFLGGAIAPGRMLQRRILHAGTAQLPETELAAEVLRRPGRTTREAIRLGVDAGALGMVRELAEIMGKALPLRNIILAGGDAGFFAREFPNWKVAPEDFTLRGVLLAAERMFF